MSRLFVIGNGFDLSHELPTRFDLDFKNIAESFEQNENFWALYQTEKADIWSDFENCLGTPDFNSLEEIFEGYEPDYLSDHESDRDAIITQVDLNTNLAEELYAFAKQAETAINTTSPRSKYCDLFMPDDLFINFNYTHTLEILYHIHPKKVLHIHGEVGKDNLILGYPEGEYNPEKYYYDVRGKGTGPYANLYFEEYIERAAENDSIDYYTYTAYTNLAQKVRSFEKKYQIDDLKEFIAGVNIEEIFVIGHSCAIDFPYFNILNNSYPNVQWNFHPYDENTKKCIIKMIRSVGIKYYRIG